MKRTLMLSILSCAMLSGAVRAQDDDQAAATENRNVTIVHGRSTADGSSELNERLLEECVVSLPGLGELEADITSKSVYLKEINGDPDNNDFVKTYSATVVINYLLHQKVLMVVTTSSIQGKDPVMKVVERKIKQSKSFSSDSGNGDIYAGRSNRKYYFSTPEAAAGDAKKRAAVWLKQQRAVVCPK
ncbi:MAG: hypothetical protein ACLFVQ_06080 [Chitinispirillaceae bacterium]